MLSDSQKDQFIQVLNNLSQTVSKASFKLEENKNLSDDEWKFYDNQFLLMHNRIKELEDLVYGS